MKSLFIIFLVISTTSIGAQTQAPLRLAVAGTTHGHVTWILSKKDRKDVVLVGIYEPDKELVKKQIERYKLSPDLFYDNLEKMLDVVKPEAVVAFGSIFEHLA